jgi:hypothetical protein
MWEMTKEEKEEAIAKAKRGEGKVFAGDRTEAFYFERPKKYPIRVERDIVTDEKGTQEFWYAETVPWVGY